MKNVIMHKPGEQSFVRWIKKRIDDNLNFLAIFEGSPGAGKSWSALSIAYAIDPEFNPRDQVAFSFRDLMRIINKFNNVGDKDNGNNNITK
jgi:replication-associated recombination protein RarA